ncbi:hypothetical protein PSAC2689_130007 [Paraburkholderia sacchari]
MFLSAFSRNDKDAVSRLFQIRRSTSALKRSIVQGVLMNSSLLQTEEQTGRYWSQTQN